MAIPGQLVTSGPSNAQVTVVMTLSSDGGSWVISSTPVADWYIDHCVYTSYHPALSASLQTKDDRTSYLCPRRWSYLDPQQEHKPWLPGSFSVFVIMCENGSRFLQRHGKWKCSYNFCLNCLREKSPSLESRCSSFLLTRWGHHRDNGQHQQKLLSLNALEGT